MVEVDDVALGVGQVGQIAVVGIVGQECDALRPNSRQDDVGDGGLARSGGTSRPNGPPALSVRAIGAGLYQSPGILGKKPGG
jgi:hypothetical protein